MVNILRLYEVRHSTYIKMINFPTLTKGQGLWCLSSHGGWDGKMGLIVVHLDDFNIILGNDFFVDV